VYYLTLPWTAGNPLDIADGCLSPFSYLALVEKFGASLLFYCSNASGRGVALPRSVFEDIFLRCDGENESFAIMFEQLTATLLAGRPYTQLDELLQQLIAILAGGYDSLYQWMDVSMRRGGTMRSREELVCSEGVAMFVMRLIRMILTIIVSYHNDKVQYKKEKYVKQLINAIRILSVQPNQQRGQTIGYQSRTSAVEQVLNLKLLQGMPNVLTRFLTSLLLLHWSRIDLESFARLSTELQDPLCFVRVEPDPFQRKQISARCIDHLVATVHRDAAGKRRVQFDRVSVEELRTSVAKTDADGFQMIGRQRRPVTTILKRPTAAPSANATSLDVAPASGKAVPSDAASALGHTLKEVVAQVEGNDHEENEDDEEGDEKEEDRDAGADDLAAAQASILLPESLLKPKYEKGVMASIRLEQMLLTLAKGAKERVQLRSPLEHFQWELERDFDLHLEMKHRDAYVVEYVQSVSTLLFELKDEMNRVENFLSASKLHPAALEVKITEFVLLLKDFMSIVYNREDRDCLSVRAFCCFSSLLINRSTRTVSSSRKKSSGTAGRRRFPTKSSTEDVM
jgi:hypothetical protein